MTETFKPFYCQLTLCHDKAEYHIDNANEPMITESLALCPRHYEHRHYLVWDSEGKIFLPGDDL
ncbi:MAG: hypothetical protein V3W44_09980 [Dehalococcoidales bacterium]